MAVIENKIMQQYENFWERKNKDRPVLNLSYNKEGAKRFRAPVSLEEKRLDANYIYDAYKHKIAQTGYLAEGVAMQFTNLGAGCLAACIGGDFTITDRTIWFDQDPIIKDWENPPKLEFNEQSKIWQTVLSIQNKFSQDPTAHFSITDLGGILDIVASLRGTNDLLYDLFDYPDEVIECCQKVKELWFKAYDKQLEIVKSANQPYNNWMNIPSLKPWYPLQCDFCYMISPEHFRQFALQDLIDQVNYMERSIYHLDGCGELVHVDALLDIPNLTGIQWIVSPTDEPLYNEKWFDLYKKIQDKKKNIVLLNALKENDLAEAEKFFKTVDPTGVYIQAHCSSKEKAENMLETICRWCE